MSTSHEEYVEAHDAYVKACGKVDVHLETCTYCDDFRSPDHYCEEADKLLKLVEETCKRRNQSVQSLHPELDLIQSSPTLSGRDRWTDFCPECGWSEDDDKDEHELMG